MKRNLLIGIPILLVVSVGGYWVGWWQSVAHYSVASAIAHSQFDLLIVNSLRKNNVAEALKWAETDLYGESITIGAFKNKVPKDFAVAYSRVSSGIQRYESEYHTDLKRSSQQQ